jgi:transposase, IS5 family
VEALFLHAFEVECIGKGKASPPYELGVKASIVTTMLALPAASSCFTPRFCRESPTTDIRSVIDATEKLIVAQSSAPMSTKAVEATTRPIRAASSSPEAQRLRRHQMQNRLAAPLSP